jgi:hypothetical protein
MPDSLPPETLAWLRQTAKFEGAVTAQVLLHLLERVEVLEKKYETQRLATLEWGKDVDKLMRWIDDHLKRIMALEKRPIPGFVDLAAPTPEAAPVVTDEELWSLWANRPKMPNSAAAALRAIYDLGRQHGAAQPPAAQPTPPAPPAAPAGGLAERVGHVIADPDAPVDLWHNDARAAIREVAAWIRSDLNGRSVADRLEQEAGR